MAVVTRAGRALQQGDIQPQGGPPFPSLSYPGIAWVPWTNCICTLARSGESNLKEKFLFIAPSS